jgi:hypothetical protein
MNLLKAVCALLAPMTSSYSAVPASAAETGKVLVILSSAKQLELPDGKRYHTGYYLDELAVPLRKIVDAGYTPVFANPKGNAVSFDPASDSKVFFGGDDAVRAQAVAFLEGIPGLQHPKRLRDSEGRHRRLRGRVHSRRPRADAGSRPGKDPWRHPRDLPRERSADGSHLPWAYRAPVHGVRSGGVLGRLWSQVSSQPPASSLPDGRMPAIV